MADAAYAPVDLNELFRGQQAHGLERMASGFDHDARMLNAITNKKFDEMEIGQAVAGKEAGKTGFPTDIAGGNIAHDTPKPRA